MTSPTIRIWYAVLISFIAIVAISLGGVMYTNHVQQTANRRWCDLFVILSPPAPPTTERGKQIAQQIDRMRRDFRCSPK